MNIDTSRALIPLQVVRQPVLAIEQKGIVRYRHRYSLSKYFAAPAEYRQNHMSGNYGPYGNRHRTSVIKGGVIDIFA